MYNSYKVFVNKNMRTGLLIETVIMFLLPAFLSHFLQFFTIVAVMVALILHLMVCIMVDFFIFGGIAVKNQKIMEYCRSSIKGYSIVKNGLITDASLTFAKILLIMPGGYILAAFVAGEAVDLRIVLLALALAFTGCGIVYFSKLVTRKLCRALQSHMLVAYLITSLMSLAFIPAVGIFSSEELSAPAAGGYLAISLLLTAGLGLGLVYEGTMGYKSGFYDK